MTRPGRVAVVALALAAASLAGCLPASLRPTPVAPAAPSSTPPPPSASPILTPAPPTPSPGPSFTLHVVVFRDTLISIARMYDTSGRSIAYWNRDQYPSLDPESADYDPDGIERGWVLRVLPGEEYVPPPDDGETGESPTPSPADDDYEEEAS
jgi:hypothetical protein